MEQLPLQCSAIICPSPSDPLYSLQPLHWMFSAPLWSHFKVLMWKKAICDLLFVEIRKALKCGRTLKVPQGAAGEGQSGGREQQKWLLWTEDTVTEAAKEVQPFPSSQSSLVWWKLLLRLPGFPRAPQTTALPWLLGTCKNEEEKGEEWGCCKMGLWSRITLGERNRSLKVPWGKCCFMALQSWPDWGYKEKLF